MEFNWEAEVGKFRRPHTIEDDAEGEYLSVPRRRGLEGRRFALKLSDGATGCEPGSILIAVRCHSVRESDWYAVIMRECGLVVRWVECCTCETASGKVRIGARCYDQYDVTVVGRVIERMPPQREGDAVSEIGNIG